MSVTSRASVDSVAPALMDAANVVRVADVETGGKSIAVVLDSVIKVFVNTSKPNYMLPWQMQRQEACTGSAFCINPVAGTRLLLTNAHVVRDWATVRVRRHGRSEKWSAKVLTVNDSCDLALLTVEEDEFWEDMKPLDISPSLPELYENTMVIGYPMGGDNICVTRGVVSRVTTLTYEDAKFFLPTRELMAIQLDAAINSGNSGGPALDESGRIVGVAFSGYAGSADNIGYIIPHPVISNFLKQFEKTGSSTTVCDFGFAYMLCENPSLRSMHKLEHPESGILVTKVAPHGPAGKGGLKENDIITKIAGSKIGNDGTIDFRRGERLSFRYKIGSSSIGDACKLVVLRDGKRKDLTVVGDSSPEVVERHRKPDGVPTYLIVGGIVFTPLTCGLLDVAVEVLSEEAWQRGRGAMNKPGEQVIVIISLLAHPLMHGYDINRLPLVVEFNGEKVVNMKQLKKMVDEVKDGYLCFKLADGKSIILDAEQVHADQEEILEKYQIPSTHSKNLDADADEDEDDSGGKPAAAKGKKPAAKKPAAKKPAAKKPAAKKEPVAKKEPAAKKPAAKKEAPKAKAKAAAATKRAAAKPAAKRSTKRTRK